MSLLANSNAIESGGYNIDRSLRFRSSAGAYLSRTATSAASTRTWTLSGWFKRGAISQGNLFGSAPSSQSFTGLGFGIAYATSEKLEFVGAVGNVLQWRLEPAQVFRDPAAWYHIVAIIDTTNATASDRIRLYINGQRVTAFTAATYPAQNYDVQYILGTTYQTNICNWYPQYNIPFDGYLAEVNFINGQALTPSSFGETSTVTGVWVPKKYTGTYGTNGFYLNFSDNTSATTLAYDKSGNGNNWTANNISTTAGATYDSMTDVPTLTSATAANYCVLNPLDVNGTISQGNLYYAGNNSGYGTRGTFAANTGKWYFECTVSSGSGTVGVADANAPLSAYNSGNVWVYYSANGNKFPGNAAYGASWTAGDVIGVALDADAGTLTFYKNNVSQGTAFSTLAGKTLAPYFGDGFTFPLFFANFGQRPFSYTPPTGFKALNTFNLPDPTIKKPNQYMDATTYTGTGSGTTKSVTNSGSFQPDLVWVKSRSNAYWHNLQDAVRGSGYALFSNSTSAESNDVGTRQISFASNGFSVSGSAADDINLNGGTFVGWQWKESATAGFDIVTYTGNGTAGTTISHSLGVAPKMIIVKSRSIVSPNYGWQVQHTSLGATKSIVLNSTSAALTSTGFWNDTAPTSSVFTVGNDWDVNKSAATYVAYLFAEIAGFSKFGSYTGNGSTDGPFVYCGFRPKYVLIKRTDTSGYDWKTYDTSRDTYNLTNHELDANLSAAETTAGSSLDINSNGFKLRDSTAGINASGGTYIYAAFAENPFKYSNAR